MCGHLALIIYIVWMSDYIYGFLRHVIVRPCPYFNGDLVILPWNLGGHRTKNTKTFSKAQT